MATKRLVRGIEGSYFSKIARGETYDLAYQQTAVEFGLTPELVSQVVKISLMGIASGRPTYGSRV